jgi:Asp/Glu/hydantoin racemase
LVEREGYGDLLRSVRALDISYAEAKKVEVFNRAMLSRLETAVSQDNARAIMFGSTTMALTPEMHRQANGRPLFMPGMTALRTIELLWYDGLWPGGRERA